jgi:hypothetical protein
MIITNSDREWVKANYPRLKFDIENGRTVVCGKFDFVACYDSKSSRYLINCKKGNKGLIVLEDSYDIKATIEDEFPYVEETGGRIIAEAKRRKVEPRDLHINDLGGACLVGPFDRCCWSLPAFLDGPMLQFFYDQSYYQLYDKWPRSQYSHDYLGVLENYYDRFSGDMKMTIKCIQLLKGYDKWVTIKPKLKREDCPKSHEYCLCDSDSPKRFRDCHRLVFNGLWLLHREVKKHHLLEIDE